MKRSWIRFIALLTCCVLLVLPVSSVFADGSEGDGEGGTSVQDATYDTVTLVSYGLPVATIVTAVYAPALELQAAQELQDYLKQISGALLTITNDVYGAQGTIIYVGSAAPDPGLAQIAAGGDDPASFRLHVAEGAIQLVGLSPQGTLYAAYELLEQIGVRWFTPGDYGTVVPSLGTIAVNVQDTIQHPGFVTRLLQGMARYPSDSVTPKVFNATEAKTWADHNRLGGEDYGVHGFPCNIKRADRPDLFMVEDGVVTTQLDVTKPEVLTCVVEGALAQLQQNPNLKYINMGPEDGGGQGYTEWDADDFDPVQGKTATTDRYVKFYNLVIAQMEQAGYPDTGIATYAYSRYTRPPVREIPNPKIMPMFAPITVERLHSIDNPLSWDRQYLKEIVDGWAALGVKMMYRGYLFNLADPGMPFSMIDQVATEFKYYSEKGFERMRVETLANWGYQGPSLYLATKMMWNPNLDVEALLDDYFTSFYGPAAVPMRAHFDRLEQAFAEADYFAGGIYDFSHILTPAVLQELELSLSQAEALAAGHTAYEARVHTTRIGFDYGVTFMEAVDAFKGFDFVQAQEKYDDAKELALEALSHKPVVVAPKTWNYMDRFFGNMIQQGYQRVTNGNSIIAQMPDEWNVILDPFGSGDKLGLWKPTLGTGPWMKLKTISETWSDQGLYYYYGHAWYKTTVTVPGQSNGHDIRLWLSNIDEAARVWLNGQELPLVTKGGALGSPWEFNATNAIRFGQANVIVVDMANEKLNELGTGGIMGPVMLWEVVTNPDITVPTAPKNLSAQAVSSGQINLSWTASTDNTGVAGYIVYRDNVEIGTVTTTTYSDLGVVPNTTYSYTVKAFDAAGNVSGSSNAVSIRIDGLPPTAPANAKATALADNQISLTWTVSTDNVKVTGYKVYRDGTEVGTTTAASYTDTGLTPDTAYSYTVKAFDAAGNLSPASNAAIATTFLAGTLFSDDFEDGEAGNWIAARGIWSVIADGSNHVFEHTVIPNTIDIAQTLAGQATWTDYTMQASVYAAQFLTSATSIVLYGRYQNTNNYYVFSYVPITHKLSVSKRVAGTQTQLGIKDYTLAANTAHTFKTVFDGSTIELYIDGVQEFSLTDSGLASGKFGFQSRDATLRIDDVEVAAIE